MLPKTALLPPKTVWHRILPPKTAMRNSIANLLSYRAQLVQRQWRWYHLLCLRRPETQRRDTKSNLHRKPSRNCLATALCLFVQLPGSSFCATCPRLFCFLLSSHPCSMPMPLSHTTVAFVVELQRQCINPHWCRMLIETGLAWDLFGAFGPSVMIQA